MTLVQRQATGGRFRPAALPIAAQPGRSSSDRWEREVRGMAKMRREKNSFKHCRKPLFELSAPNTDYCSATQV